MNLFEDNGAEFSACKQYRYCLWRIWDRSLPLIMFIGLNPSTANATDDDPTVRRVKSMAKGWGFGGVYMMNCFPLVSTDPEALRSHDMTVYAQHQDFLNRQQLIAVSKQCEEVVFAWGNFQIVKDFRRDQELSVLFPDAKALIINKDGSPRHPLYVPTKTTLIKYKNITNDPKAESTGADRAILKGDL